MNDRAIYLDNCILRLQSFTKEAKLSFGIMFSQNTESLINKPSFRPACYVNWTYMFALRKLGLSLNLGNWAIRVNCSINHDCIVWTHFFHQPATGYPDSRAESQCTMLEHITGKYLQASQKIEPRRENIRHISQSDSKWKLHVVEKMAKW